jgi:DNA-binding beta-propeller fold protein YncE
MSLDELARTSATALLDAAAARTDTASGRTSLRHTVHRRRRTRAVVAALLVLVLAGSVLTVEATLRKRPQPIAPPAHAAAIVVHGPTGSIYLVDPTTGAARELSFVVGSDAGFGHDIVGTSPDGTHVVYQVGGGSLNLADLVSPSVRDLPAGAGGWQPAVLWTGDGVTVASFSQDRGLRVERVRDGRLVDQLVVPIDMSQLDLSFNVLPSWSPDGRHLAFSAMDRHNHRNVYVVDADGTSLREVDVTSGPGSGAGQVAWSPDGSRIAYVDDNGPEAQSQLVLIDPDGTNRTVLGAIGTACEEKHTGCGIAWAPDSRSIAFLGKGVQVPGWALYVMGLDGTVRRLQFAGVDGFTIAWAAGSR